MRISSLYVPKTMLLSTRTKFQLEIPTINVFSGIVYFREIIIESSRNVSETIPSPQDIYILGLMDVFGVNVLDVLKTLP